MNTSRFPHGYEVQPYVLNALRDTIAGVCSMGMLVAGLGGCVLAAVLGALFGWGDLSIGFGFVGGAVLFYPYLGIPLVWRGAAFLRRTVHPARTVTFSAGMQPTHQRPSVYTRAGERMIRVPKEQQ